MKKAYYEGHEIEEVFGYYDNTVLFKTKDEPFRRAALRKDIEIVEEE